MDAREEILRNNFKEYFESAEEALKKSKYNVATTLFFKAIAAGCDLAIFIDEQLIPSSHTDRFRILEQRYPVLYRIANKTFPFYQQSYTAKMDKETAPVLKQYAEQIKKNLKI
ncbi:TPA: hypothetical protein HA235_02100 [Candidatus Woesearchaeota archaeon]|nr:hypothetical protein [Candidatus Woesearchaeota archaeon]HIH31475.1 hypothetical protein [Candidatus Woesearchaeota archaeon]HIH55240.1 hypothetical protein [Candidatus Woesearchaeota archaeon]HIJ01975.1 hypothetical protein [Candidatus Woesearchaeota archaeon]HIJ14524.1 hypothetical protein [Candidatus Woesearchaeota archaeon]